MYDISKKLTVGVIAGDRSGPFFHDFGVPIPFMEKNTGLKFTSFETLTPKVLKDFDIIHFQRQYAPESLMILRNLKENGIITIGHCDDNVWELPRSNPAYSTYQGAVLERFQQIIAEAHAVTTSTLYLKELISKFNTNCYIFRNLVDPTIENFRTTDRDNPNEIRIGWTLTSHHAEDSEYAIPALKDICQRYQQVKLVFMGWLPPLIKDTLKKERYEYYDFVPVDSFYCCMANLDLDIGIAPLKDNEFNKGKTGRKAQEYSILRIPMILSPVSTYDEWKHNETCLKPEGNKHYNWTKELSKLIEQPELRKRLSNNAHEQVLRDHDINKFIAERANTYYEIYNQVKNGE